MDRMALKWVMRLVYKCLRNIWKYLECDENQILKGNRRLSSQQQNNCLPPHFPPFLLLCFPPFLSLPSFLSFPLPPFLLSIQLSCLPSPPFLCLPLTLCEAPHNFLSHDSKVGCSPKKRKKERKKEVSGR